MSDRLGLCEPSPETMLRELNRRFRRVWLWRDKATYRIEAEGQPLSRDSRVYMPRAWAPTAAAAIEHLWRKA